MARGRRHGTANIDITPLIDVLFMLIIFFVLTASFTQGYIEVALPAGGGAPPDKRAVTLTVEKDGGLLWDGRRITSGELAELASASAGREIVIAGDLEAPYGEVAGALEILRREGVSSTGLLMRGGD